MSTEDKTTLTSSWLSTWLVTMGMSQTWANIIATAIISAATAVIALMQTSCDLASVSSNQSCTTLVGNDGSSAVICNDPTSGWSFTWSQAASLDADGESGELILVEGDAQ